MKYLRVTLVNIVQHNYYQPYLVECGVDMHVISFTLDNLFQYCEMVLTTLPNFTVTFTNSFIVLHKNTS